MTKALGTALAAIKDLDSGVGHHLETCIKRGLY